jgi:hypothetical protein
MPMPIWKSAFHGGSAIFLERGALLREFETLVYAGRCSALRSNSTTAVSRICFAFAAVWNIFVVWIELKIRSYEQGIYQDRRRA